MQGDADTAYVQYLGRDRPHATGGGRRAADPTTALWTATVQDAVSRLGGFWLCGEDGRGWRGSGRGVGRCVMGPSASLT
jgi:hypothetical protein